MASIEGFLKFLKKELGDDNRKVKKSVKAKKEWIASKKEMDTYVNEAESLINKATSMKNGLWSTIEGELNDYNHDMRWSKDGTEVEIMANEDEEVKEDGAVVSPFSKGK